MIVFSILVGFTFWICFAIVVETWKPRIICLVLIIVIASFFGRVTDGIINKNDKKIWNNGYCSECNAKYKLTSVSEYYFCNYYYTCENCDHTIKLHTIHNK